VFAENPAFEPDPAEKVAGRRLTSEIEGIRRWGGGEARVQGAPPPPRLRVRDALGPDDIVFRTLGHAGHARASYPIFSRLRDEGAIKTGTLFQVALPTAAAMLNGHIVPYHHAIVEAPLTRRLFADVADICAAIPHHDLAVQWDIPCEMSQWEGVRPAWFADVKDGIIERLARHINAVPASVQLGLHFCYGSYGGRHWMEPKDTANCVEAYNRVVDRIGRPLQWIHLPVPIERDDEAYFAPLAALKRRPETELYLGLIHLQDGEAGARRRIAAAEKFVADFGIATECGFGRRPPETIPDLLKLHAAL
jgi:methionine synthase II (cobalamin-independent)